VLNELRKKEAALESVNTAFLRSLNPDDIVVHVERAGEAEMDEMWSFVGKKKEPRWLWHAIAHCTGAILLYVFAPIPAHSLVTYSFPGSSAKVTL
jgi:IS1 transposase